MYIYVVLTAGFHVIMMKNIFFMCRLVTSPVTDEGFTDNIGLT